MEEIWKAVEDFEGIYEVSNTGFVRSVDRICCDGRHLKGKVLSCSLVGSIHKQWSVTLSKYGKRTSVYVSRLVAQAFISNPHNYKNVSYLDNDRDNLCYTNLYWADPYEFYRCKPVTDITTGVHYRSGADCADALNVSRFAVYNSIRRNCLCSKHKLIRGEVE